MIKWIKHNETHFTLQQDDYKKEIDTLEKLFVWSLFLGIPLKEIEIALLEMQRNEHNLAEFGMKKTFIYSRRLES